jgi:succinyl-diaminopimelate desuccinylase
MLSSDHFTPTQLLTQVMISHPSVTPVDGGLQELIAKRLRAIEFECETMMSGPDDFRVTNLWAIRHGAAGKNGPCLVFAGHTDVVPTDPAAGPV